jgi:hypothetical protein
MIGFLLNAGDEREEVPTAAARARRMPDARLSCRSVHELDNCCQQKRVSDYIRPRTKCGVDASISTARLRRYFRMPVSLLPVSCGPVSICDACRCHFTAD